MNVSPSRLFVFIMLGLAWLGPQSPVRAAGKLTGRFSHTADNPLRGGSSPAGGIGVNATFLEWEASAAASPTTRIAYGLSWSFFDFKNSGSVALPGQLHEASLTLGASRRLDSRWLLMASLNPGLFGELEGDAADAFNVPGLFLATWLQNRELAWSFGLRADAFADNPVLPVLGVRWAFAPRWEFTLGFPRAGFGYEATPSLKLGLGATVQGGSFHVARDPRSAPVTGPRLDDTYLDYREIRLGLAADYRLSATLSVTAEAGVVTDQRFDYHEKDFALNGDAAAFFTIGLSGSF